ncbi:hypothetical protein KM043_007672 [Ampulex compressa]|nr:hypothetical protein KM043_007672 [Ampulex compressa]
MRTEELKGVVKGNLLGGDFSWGLVVSFDGLLSGLDWWSLVVGLPSASPSWQGDFRAQGSVGGELREFQGSPKVRQLSGQEARLLQVSKVRQGLPLAQEHEEPPEDRVRQGSQGVLPLLSSQDEVQEQPAKAHTQDSLWMIICTAKNVDLPIVNSSYVAIMADERSKSWCGRPFAWPSSLRLHQKMACGKPPNFYCTVCEYKSNFKGNLKRHLFCKHRIDMY